MWRFRTFSEAWPRLSSVCLSRLWGPAHTKPRLIFPPYPTSPDTVSRPHCPPAPPHLPPSLLPIFPAYSGRDRLPSLIQVRCLSSGSLSCLSKHLSHGFFPWGGEQREEHKYVFLKPPLLSPLIAYWPLWGVIIWATAKPWDCFLPGSRGESKDWL